MMVWMYLIFFYTISTFANEILLARNYTQQKTTRSGTGESVETSLQDCGVFSRFGHEPNWPGARQGKPINAICYHKFHHKRQYCRSKRPMHAWYWSTNTVTTRTLKMRPTLCEQSRLRTLVTALESSFSWCNTTTRYINIYKRSKIVNRKTWLTGFRVLRVNIGVSIEHSVVGLAERGRRHLPVRTEVGLYRSELFDTWIFHDDGQFICDAIVWIGLYWPILTQTHTKTS